MPKKKRGPAGTPALLRLEQAAVPHTVHYYEVTQHGTGAGWGEEAADSMGVPRERVFKTLLADLDGTLAVGVVPVSGQLDLKALAAALGAKRAALADPAAAERATGYVLGGISPLGQRTALRTVVDDSALGHATVFVSAGRRGLEVELAPADLVRLTGARTAEIGRG
ncbi:Cys-tRNA(Pro) deacylase [Kitasatospora sp. NPDC049285]|uniref:Cys-tRNA(Pro) deacylase n=1 Tax=Kitasatospora sp. NPDC049285 TaxID=3157096 RepID=UPI003428358E